MQLCRNTVYNQRRLSTINHGKEKRISEGSYASVWRKLREKRERESSNTVIFSPFSPGVPWVTFEIVNDCVTSIVRDSHGGKPTVATAISALSFILRQQDELGNKHLLSNKVPTLRLLTQKD